MKTIEKVEEKKKVKRFSLFAKSKHISMENFFDISNTHASNSNERAYNIKSNVVKINFWKRELNRKRKKENEKVKKKKWDKNYGR